MAPKHWQIIKRDQDGRKLTDGDAETLPVEHCPPGLIRLALKATALIGDGLYGVDLKQTDKGLMIIEVNDNPSLETQVEDKVLKDELYERILKEFIRRIDAKK